MNLTDREREVVWAALWEYAKERPPLAGVTVHHPGIARDLFYRLGEVYSR